MRAFTFLAASLMLPATMAFAQTPAPAAGTTSSEAAFIPLFGTGGGTSGTGANSTWYIDTTNKLVVLCAQSTSGGGGGAPSFNCTAQTVQTVQTSTGGATPSAGAGATPAAGTPAAGAAATPAAGTPSGGASTSAM